MVAWPLRERITDDRTAGEFRQDQSLLERPVPVAQGLGRQPPPVLDHVELVLAIVAELVGNPAGHGHAVIRAQQALQPERLFAYVVAAGLLGITLNGLLRTAVARLLPVPTEGEGVAPW